MPNYVPIRGDYGVVSTSGFVGFLIQLGTRSKDNHAFIYEGNGVIIEATPRKGIIRSSVDSYSNIIWNKHEAKSTEQRDIIVKAAGELVGLPYSFRAIALDATRILHIKVPGFLTRWVANAKGFDCSGSVARCYKAAGITVDPLAPVYEVTPATLSYRLLFL